MRCHIPLLSCAALCLANPLVALTPDLSSGQPYTLENTVVVPFHSDAANRDYQLMISYPGSYKEGSGNTYPVIYAVDGYWNFTLFNALRGGLVYDHAVPDFIIVGIGYSGENVNYDRERCLDLTPVSSKEWEEPTGGAGKFLAAIKDEIIPFVEANTPADPDFRVLAGASLGGLFSLYAMYEEPGLFQGHIAVSPALVFDHGWLIAEESRLRTAHGEDARLPMPTRLYMTAAENEWPVFRGYIEGFNKILQQVDYEDFDYSFRLIENEGHAGTNAESYTRGLQFVFDGYEADAAH